MLNIFSITKHVELRNLYEKEKETVYYKCKCEKLGIIEEKWIDGNAVYWLI